MAISKTISLIIVDNLQHDLARFSIEQTIKNVECKEIIIFSDKNFYPCTKFVPIKKNITVYDYSDIILNHLWLFLETDFALITQFDGMAVDKTKWSDDFLNYDYIGAPWQHEYNGNRVGNGGFSLRSKKLIEALRDTKIQLGGASKNLEDSAICAEFKTYLEEKYNIQYAPLELAEKFAHELSDRNDTLGFHGIWNTARYFDYQQLEYLIENMPSHIWKSDWKYKLFFELLAKRGFKNLINLSIEKIKSAL